MNKFFDFPVKLLLWRNYKMFGKVLITSQLATLSNIENIQKFVQLFMHVRMYIALLVQARSQGGFGKFGRTVLIKKRSTIL